MKPTPLVLLALLLGSCATHHTLVVGTGTVIGVEIAENPATGLYQAKLGYNRGEVAFVPVTTNGVAPDVLTELRYSGIFSRNGGIYQRLAIGAKAVSQPGATILFARDAEGRLSQEAVQALNTIPAASVTPERAAQAELARRYVAAPNKAAWNSAVAPLGYATFLDFLKLIAPTMAQVSTVATAVAGL